MISKSRVLFAKVIVSKRLLCLLLLTALILAYYLCQPVFFSVNSFNLTEWTVNVVEQLKWQNDSSQTWFNVVILLFFLALATSIGLPRQIAALVAGINLGALVGVVVATVAATLGCLITLSISR